MSNEFHMLEESLRKFLIDALSDSYNARNTNFGKFNNLKMFILPAKNSKAHFCLRIGISEAMFDLETREKLSGGLGSDERLVRRWMERLMVVYELKQAWEKQHKIKATLEDN